MKSLKIPGLALFFILLLIPACSGGSAADQNETALPAQPYISIDPVANPSLDEVFYMTGTTNLPSSGSPLLLQIGSNWYNPGGSGCGYQSNVTIIPGKNGINTWSCNTTPDLWQTYGIGPRPRITAGAVPGEYEVKVSSLDPRISANATGFFSVLPSENTGNSAAANPGVTPNPSATVVSDPVGYGISDSTTPLQNSTQGTAGQTGNPPREVPTTHPAPLLPAVSIAAMGLGVLASQGFRKK